MKLLESFNFIALKEDENKRIDIFLNENIKTISRNKIQKLIEESQVFVNDKSINKNYKIKQNDNIAIFLKPPEEQNITAEDIPLDIIYEDMDIIVINKPQNMVVHPAPGNYNGTLVNALMHHCKQNLSSINGTLRPGIVHRIDKDTSGILVVAKNDFAHNKLAIQLANHSMHRIYYAIVFGKLKNNKGTIDAPIGRNPKDRKKMAVVYKNCKQAITNYTVLEYFDKFTFVKLKLQTGRTHQIRVHMSYIGHPLLGDTVYGFKNQPFSLKGQALHAKALGFIHPTKDEYMEFETDLPLYFTKIINKLKNN